MAEDCGKRVLIPGRIQLRNATTNGGLVLHIDTPPHDEYLMWAYNSKRFSWPVVESLYCLPHLPISALKGSHGVLFE